MKRMMKKLAAVLLSVIVMGLALTGCGGSKGPKDCKDWTEGIMEINGGIITIGKTKIDEFKTTTGFSQEVKVSDYSDGTAYYTLSDGYSVIQVYAESDGRVTYFFASDTFEGLNVDAEHTSITGPGGITVGSSTVEDLAEYDKNTKDRYNSSVQDQSTSCNYIAGKAEGTFGMKDEYIYSTYGNLETRVIYEMMLKVDE